MNKKIYRITINWDWDGDVLDLELTDEEYECFKIVFAILDDEFDELKIELKGDQ